MTSVAGTTSYMAPEQFGTQDGVSSKTDMWAFAATVVHMLTGSPPFTGQSHYDVAHKVLHQRQSPAIPWSAAAVPKLRDLLKQCFSADPAARPSAAEALRLLLEAEQEYRKGAGGSPQFFASSQSSLQEAVSLAKSASGREWSMGAVALPSVISEEDEEDAEDLIAAHVPEGDCIFVGEGRLAARVAGIFASISSVCLQLRRKLWQLGRAASVLTATLTQCRHRPWHHLQRLHVRLDHRPQAAPSGGLAGPAHPVCQDADVPAL